MEFTCNSVRPKKIYVKFGVDGEEQMIKKYRCNGELIWSAAQPITYMVDTGAVYTEDIDCGKSALEPTSFTPTKSGYIFVGWREDNAVPSGTDDVISSKVVESEPFTLYAVFKKTITVSYNGNGSTGGSTASESKSAYYNNGNTWNPSFTLKSNGFTKTSYKFGNWRMGSTSGTAYAVGASVTLSSDTTFYAYWVESTMTKELYTNHWSGGEDDVITATVDLTHYTTYSIQYKSDKNSSGYGGGTAKFFLNGSQVATIDTDYGDWTTAKSNTSIPAAARKAGVVIQMTLSGGVYYNGNCRFIFT